jgi:hypothetical protein
LDDSDAEINLNVGLKREVDVLPILYHCGFFMFYGEHTMLPGVTFVVCLETQ